MKNVGIIPPKFVGDFKWKLDQLLTVAGGSTVRASIHSWRQDLAKAVANHLGIGDDWWEVYDFICQLPSPSLKMIREACLGKEEAARSMKGARAKTVSLSGGKGTMLEDGDSGKADVARKKQIDKQYLEALYRLKPEDRTRKNLMAAVGKKPEQQYEVDSYIFQNPWFAKLLVDGREVGDFKAWLKPG